MELRNVTFMGIARYVINACVVAHNRVGSLAIRRFKFTES